MQFKNYPNMSDVELQNLTAVEKSLGISLKISFISLENIKMYSPHTYYFMNPIKGILNQKFNKKKSTTKELVIFKKIIFRFKMC